MEFVWPLQHRRFHVERELELLRPRLEARRFGLARAWAKAATTSQVNFGGSEARLGMSLERCLKSLI